jgi:amino acid transporter
LDASTAIQTESKIDGENDPKRNADSGKLPIGAIVGIAVGGILIVVGAVVLIVFVSRKREAGTENDGIEEFKDDLVNA